MKINIVGGRGVMGRVHAEIFRKAGHEVIITGRKTKPAPAEAAKICDVTIVSVPIDVTENVIKLVAPHAKAIIDFTGLKMIPLEAMMKYARKDAEVCGLHPLYGNVESIAGKTIVCCRTKKSGKLCKAVVDALKSAGARIVEMNPREHDLHVGAIAQNARLMMLEGFMKVLRENRINISAFYKICPPPTKAILDLIARQADASNDELYQVMKKYNPFTQKAANDLRGSFEKKISSEEIRKMFGKELKPAQKRAKKLIEADKD